MDRLFARVRKGQDDEDSESAPAKRNTAAMKHVMTTLKHPGNPLASRAGLSEVGEPVPSIVTRALLIFVVRTHNLDYVWSCATGHQQGDGKRGNAEYFKHRDARVDAQRDPATSSLFRGCRIYCNSSCI